MVSLRTAVDEEPASLRPQALAASRWARVNGVGSGPASIPSIRAGMSCSSASIPNASTSSGSAPARPCGQDVEASRMAGRVLHQRVEVRRLELFGVDAPGLGWLGEILTRASLRRGRRGWGRPATAGPVAVAVQVLDDPLVSRNLGGFHRQPRC